MTNLKEFYLSTIKDNNYFYKFYDSIRRNVFIDDHTVLDEEDAIEQFKTLIQPGVEKHNSYQDNLHFILLCYYLNRKGFQIKQFPTILSHPGNILEFAYNAIRSYIGGNPVLWADRRKLISDLEFIKEAYNVPYQLNNQIKLISTRGASFDQMQPDEKLETLCNLIENLLKEDGRFISIFEEPIFQILDDDKIRKYRNATECFRHAHNKALKERASYSDFEKDFLIRYGIFIIETIYKKLNQ